MNINHGGKRHKVFLVDSGTLDTEITVDGIHHIFNGEFASQFRKRDGSLTARGLRELALQVLENTDET